MYIFCYTIHIVSYCIASRRSTKRTRARCFHCSFSGYCRSCRLVAPHIIGSWLLLFTNLTPRDRADVIFCWVSNENGSPVIVQNLNETVFIPQTEKKSQSTQKKSAHRPANLFNKCNSAISLDSPIVTVYKCNGNRPRTDE